ncbi:hypothetical protein C8F01DRAFT_1125700 [Mycena amicta]|nr:hypothetical protein C8F01DRAFT_1125700 [Mycena amicta]
MRTLKLLLGCCKTSRAAVQLPAYVRNPIRLGLFSPNSSLRKSPPWSPWHSLSLPYSRPTSASHCARLHCTPQAARRHLTACTSSCRSFGRSSAWATSRGAFALRVGARPQLLCGWDSPIQRTGPTSVFPRFRSLILVDFGRRRYRGVYYGRHRDE